MLDLAVDPELDVIRDDERYVKLLAEMGLDGARS